jgi:hypothetical protein
MLLVGCAFLMMWLFMSRVLFICITPPRTSWWTYPSSLFLTHYPLCLVKMGSGRPRPGLGPGPRGLKANFQGHGSTHSEKPCGLGGPLGTQGPTQNSMYNFICFVECYFNVYDHISYNLGLKSGKKLWTMALLVETTESKNKKKKQRDPQPAVS